MFTMVVLDLLSGVRLDIHVDKDKYFIESGVEDTDIGWSVMTVNPSSSQTKYTSRKLL